MDQTRNRLAGVDVLRGLCILSVVIHHIHLRFTTSRNPVYPVRHVLPETLEQVLFWSGLYAVIAFFVISGFLITGLSIRRWGELGTVHAGRFYRMRMARILPCLLLVLAVLSLLLFMAVRGAEVRPEHPGLGRTLFAALTFHMNWLEGHYGWSAPAWGVLWSLSIEEVFYIAFPLVCLTVRSEKFIPWALLALIVVGPINRVLLAAHLRITALRGPQGPGVEFLEYLAPTDGRPMPGTTTSPSIRCCRKWSARPSSRAT